jgi:hypothetical protein
MLRIKALPNHKFSAFIELSGNIDPEWCLGRVDKEGKFIEAEVECEIDGHKALIRLHDYFKEKYESLPLLNFVLKLAYGLDGKQCQKVLLAKYPGKVDAKTEVTVILYELIEIELN